MRRPQVTGQVIRRRSGKAAVVRGSLAALCAVTALSVLFWGAREAYAFFTNLQRTTGTISMTAVVTGTIIIDKVTDPAGDPQSFAFTLTGGPSELNQVFSLTDASTPHNSGPVQPGFNYSVAETVPDGWDLTSATCDDGSPVGDIEMSAGETITCTFTNTKRGEIQIEKQTVPDGSPQTFSFTGDLMALLSDGQSASRSVRPGTYTAIEGEISGWVVSSIGCNDTDSSGNESSRTAVFRVSAGEEVTCTYTNTRPGIPGPSINPQALAKRFAPILLLDSLDLFRPLDQPSYVRATDLKKRRADAAGNVIETTVVKSTPGIQDLPNEPIRCGLPENSQCYFLDVPDREPADALAPLEYASLQETLFANGAKHTVYWNVTQGSSGEVAIQYWFLYVFNDYFDFQLGANRHESDWEQITIILNRELVPQRAVYAHHATAWWKPWNEIQRLGDHPKVYVARGSHASYFSSGTFVFDQPFCFRAWPTGDLLCYSVRDFADGEGETLAPVKSVGVLAYGLDQLDEPRYVGQYGSGNFVFITLPFLAEWRPISLELTDPRTREAWTQPFVWSAQAERAP